MRMNEEYSWVPPGLSQSRIEEYMKQLPIKKVPRIGTDGEKYRERQLSLQLPKVDISSKYCSYLDPVNQISYEGFISARNDIALDVGHVVDFCKNRGQCSGCDKTLTAGSLAVCAPKLPTNLYHPGCFTCTQCQELLVDLTYCTYENNLYCERHYAERFLAAG
ncbi:protein espinas [Eurytemora carolleeae]|uniref:protein espinas n=1 Tax=Eurytemora carolleeae TaxID=1294199 RepID=UPI000C767C14|nr:protein espinas [Eurytemora carolleeae]|eukprot:XP_023341603.1 protein espinas-like [Eurytemora affinis]